MSSGAPAPSSLSPSPKFSSFPPLFRNSIHKSNPIAINDSNHDTAHVDPYPLPLIDIEHLELEKLDEACKYFGMFRLVNHGIPANVVNQLHGHARRVFDLNFESKQALFTGSSNTSGDQGGDSSRDGSSSSTITYFWGKPALTSSGSVLEGGPQEVNWFEALNVPLGQLQLLQTQDPLLIRFSSLSRNLLEEYGRHMTRLAETLFEALRGHLQVDQVQREGYLDTAGAHMRIYRYPSSSIADQLKGLDAHTDSSVLTILNEDEVGGLQLFKDNKWLDVKPLPSTLVVNVGDLIQAMSDDKYKSATHRVKLSKHKERISIGYFVFPKENSLIPSSKYKPFTYKDYRAQNQEDITTIGWKIGLDRFKLPNQVL